MWVDYADGKRLNTATLIVEKYEASKWWEKFANEGLNAVVKYGKNKLGKDGASLDQAEAIVVASPTEILFLPADRIVKKYNTKSYTHTFVEYFTTITIDWSNTNGISINGINSGNLDKPKTWINVIGKAFNESKPKLTNGEVLVCAGFGNVWKGMKITTPK
ncbi:hypothetical protein FACS1894169_12500 [Bacteroidia bacterium]|nr:hypothetical protein FACS1894169_12500 [Bacteroidia bacterium]